MTSGHCGIWLSDHRCKFTDVTIERASRSRNQVDGRQELQTLPAQDAKGCPLATRSASRVPR